MTMQRSSMPQQVPILIFIHYLFFMHAICIVPILGTWVKVTPKKISPKSHTCRRSTVVFELCMYDSAWLNAVGSII